MSEISDRLTQVRARIAAAAHQCGRQPEQIKLLAVSKTKPVEAIQDAIAAGQRAFGENYLQEAVKKIQTLAKTDLQMPQDLEWHYIGRIQSNKTRPIAEHFDWVHSLSDAAHARRLSDQRPDELAPLQVCVQVNLSGQASKSGIDSAALPELAQSVADLPRLKLRGLMTMPDPGRPPQEQRADFHRLSDLADEMRAHGLVLDTLSMGMSGDLEAAIAEGSTLVRVGTDIFGARG